MDTAAAFLLFPLTAPEFEKRFSPENFYAIQTRLSELDEEETENFSQEIEETDPVELRNDRFLRICDAFFRYLLPRTGFFVHEFIASLNEAQLSDFCRDNALPQVILHLYALQTVSIADWRASEEMIVEPMGEFELSWCLSQLPEACRAIDSFTVEKTDPPFSFAVTEADHQRQIRMSDFRIEVTR